MTSRIAIIGSGPTGMYTQGGLNEANRPLSITVFEIEADAGKGTPYHPHINDQAMLANIASVELPAICETLVAWLRRQPDLELQRLNVERAAIRERDSTHVSSLANFCNLSSANWSKSAGRRAIR